MAQPEQEVGVGKAEHGRHVDHDRSGDVTRVSLGMRALQRGEREALVRRHARHHAPRLAVELEDLVEQDGLGRVGAVGHEARVQH
jgi:hypothetical protein